MSRKPIALEAKALDLIGRGLVTQAEAAALIGISRQRVHLLCLVAQIDAPAARQRHIKKLWGRASGH
jgi:hypothetical protein